MCYEAKLQFLFVPWHFGSKSFSGNKNGWKSVQSKAVQIWVGQIWEGVILGGEGDSVGVKRWARCARHEESIALGQTTSPWSPHPHFVLSQKSFSAHARIFSILLSQAHSLDWSLKATLVFSSKTDAHTEGDSRSPSGRRSVWTSPQCFDESHSHAGLGAQKRLDMHTDQGRAGSGQSWDWVWNDPRRQLQLRQSFIRTCVVVTLEIPHMNLEESVHGVILHRCVRADPMRSFGGVQT